MIDDDVKGYFAVFALGFIITFLALVVFDVVKSDRISCPAGSVPVNGRCLVEVAPI